MTNNINFTTQQELDRLFARINDAISRFENSTGRTIDTVTVEGDGSEWSFTALLEDETGEEKADMASNVPYQADTAP